MELVRDIFNSEGTLLGIARDGNHYFLQIKKRNNNEYAYFPLNRLLLQLYFEGEITLRELLPSYESFELIDTYYQNVDPGNIRANPEDILMII